MNIEEAPWCDPDPRAGSRVSFPLHTRRGHTTKWNARHIALGATRGTGYQLVSIVSGAGPEGSR